MTNICKTVTLRKRPIGNGTQESYYLDYYPGYRDERTMKLKRHETLGIYVYAHPRNRREREYNERMHEKAEALRCRRYESIVNERYDFFDREKMNGSFVEYFREIAEKEKGRWLLVFRHFETFAEGKCTFMEVNVELCNRFREYLLHGAKSSKATKEPKPLHVNTASLYWSSFRAVLHRAYKEHRLRENPNGYLEKIGKIPTEKEHLSQQELIRLAGTPCRYEVLKTAFLFSCLTGLRKSDVKALTWNRIQPYGDGGMYITVRMQKTRQFVNNPVSEEALELIGFHDGDGNRKPTDRVFRGLNDSMTQKPLAEWLEAAGVTKHISYHCSRHTFGSLQVDAGTSIYAVQHMLGHKNVSTTQIYADMGDESKRQSVNRITLRGKPEKDAKGTSSSETDARGTGEKGTTKSGPDC